MIRHVKTHELEYMSQLTLRSKAHGIILKRLLKHAGMNLHIKTDD